jgi:NAD(P)-dependent dehydrogenase (short-subunit alcohol dehydrogenase family)
MSASHVESWRGGRLGHWPEEFRQLFGDTRVDDDIARVGRAGTAPDVVPAVLFLCSDGARWINGANLPVDGGLVNASVLEF